ncbi:two-component hybrid sensor and regulator [Calothrix sp. NIES-4071]|nr:two-component hybrid sensor and regulator [Calothrix sp. NIES-4071]BAZ56449.1 two-component hybrid sensor and regulator [Calothrix sp. NIES-4105]
MIQNQKTVLIVDDNYEDRETYRRYLLQDKQYIYRILQAESANLGLELCKQAKPDVVLLDFMLPDMNARAFIDQLQAEFNNNTNKLPVVILTSQQDEAMADDEESYDYLIKEKIDAVGLRFAVHKLIEQTRLELELEISKQFIKTALNESEKRFRLFADNLDAIIWIASPDSSQHFYANKAYEKIWHRSCDSLISQPLSWLDAVHPEDYERVLVKLEQQESGQLTNIEYRIIRPDGQERWVWDRGFPIRDENGALSYYVGITEDITEQKLAHEQIRHLTETLEQQVMERTSQLQAANNELEAFAYTVSHDLRAPLRAMQGFAEALAEDYGKLLDEVGNEYIARIINSAQRLENLIQDLLSYSRLSRTDLYLQPVNLNNVMFEVMTQLDADLKAKNAQVTISAPLRAVLAHRNTIAQVIANLLTNAIKFVRVDEQPQVLIWSEIKTPGWVRLWVKDNGIGIKAEHHKRIFSVFERLHGIERYPGTGIGLAIVRKGVERMGGRVGLESLPGQGSSFWIELKDASR